MYMGYCVQFLHQCHLSGGAPLTYSTIFLPSQNDNYVITDIFQFPLLETWLRLIISILFLLLLLLLLHKHFKLFKKTIWVILDKNGDLEISLKDPAYSNNSQYNDACGE
jgi:hypothetical protein